jgi:hypothetical protein
MPVTEKFAPVQEYLKDESSHTLLEEMSQLIDKGAHNFSTVRYGCKKHADIYAFLSPRQRKNM